VFRAEGLKLSHGLDPIFLSFPCFLCNVLQLLATWLRFFVFGAYQFATACNTKRSEEVLSVRLQPLEVVQKKLGGKPGSGLPAGNIVCCLDASLVLVLKRKPPGSSCRESEIFARCGSYLFLLL